MAHTKEMVTTHPSIRLWYNRRKFKTKPMTKEEGFAIRVEFTTLTPEESASKRRKTEVSPIPKEVQGSDMLDPPEETAPQDVPIEEEKQSPIDLTTKLADGRPYLVNCLPYLRLYKDLIDKGKAVANEEPAGSEAQEKAMEKKTDQENKEASKKEAKEIEQEEEESEYEGEEVSTEAQKEEVKPTTSEDESTCSESENALTKNTTETTPAHTSMESKTAQVTLTPSVDHTKEDVHFSSNGVRQRYKDFAKSLAHVEKGFDQYCVNLIPCVGNIVEFFGWEKLCAIPKPSNLTWVREFYTAASMTESTEIVVRGRHVSYSPKAINAYFGLNPPRYTEFARIMTEPTEEDLEDVLDTVAQPGTTWRHSRKLRQKTFLANQLTFDASIWFHYLRHSLIPTTHDSYVSLDRMKLLHCIMSKQSINVGMVISTAIAICSKKRVQKLFFPALITGLLREAGVRKLKDDEILIEKVNIDKITTERIRTHYKPVIVTRPPPPPPPRGAASDVEPEAVTLLRAIKDHQGEILGKLKALEERMEKQEQQGEISGKLKVLEERMEKQEQIWVKAWRYEKKRKRVGKKVLKA